MSESQMRDALLNQNGPANLEFELKMLSNLMDMEGRRSRRLLIWTIVVAVLWFVDFVAMFGGYMLFANSAMDAAKNADQAAQQQPDAQQPAEPQTSSAAVFMIIAVMLGFAGLLGLPIVGLVLLVMLVMSPRSNQLRASVASIDAQLRTLAATHKPPATPTSAGG